MGPGLGQVRARCALGEPGLEERPTQPLRGNGRLIGGNGGPLLACAPGASNLDQAKGDPGQDGEGGGDIGEGREIHLLKINATFNVQRPTCNEDAGARPFFFIERWTLSVGR